MIILIIWYLQSGIPGLYLKIIDNFRKLYYNKYIDEQLPDLLDNLTI